MTTKRQNAESRGDARTVWILIEQLAQDVRYGLRGMFKNRLFTGLAALSLALGIGANTTIFSIAKQLLFDRLAVPQAANLRLLTWTGGGDHVPSLGFSYPVYEQLRAQTRVLGDLLAFHVT